MYYVLHASAPSLHRESTDSLIHAVYIIFVNRGCSLYKFCNSMRIMPTETFKGPMQF